MLQKKASEQEVSVVQLVQRVLSNRKLTNVVALMQIGLR